MSRWQREWKTLSSKSKKRLVRYAGHGARDLRKMRWGMFVPRHPEEKLAVWDRLDQLVFESAMKYCPDIRVFGSRVGPFALREPGTSGYIGMPKDPVIWSESSGWLSRKDLKEIAGTFRRNTLEHERSELRVFRERAKRTRYGKFMRSQKAIYGKGSNHNGVYPLIAELNVSGRSEKTVKMVMEDWGGIPAQDQVFAILKQFGWTPSSGLPNYGKVSTKAQRRVERVFAPHFRTLIDTQIKRIERRYKGKALRRKKEEILYGASQLAGGQGLRKKYLK